jgi:flavin-dependent thymidylate synthase
MYAGIPTYSFNDITDDERKQYWEESLVTNLKAAWEFVDFHFFIEGVTRAFTHQAVRQRTAVYAQESLRFAVKRGFAQEAALPPGVATNEGALAIWERMLGQMEEAYNQLIDSGIPAEDARGLLPHCVTTRLNYKTNFRNLIETLGNRLCTQAQFEWRSVALGYMKAIKGYWPHGKFYNDRNYDAWQFEILGSPLAETFTPVCYKAGKCVFMGKLDRGCTIRERVNSFADAGCRLVNGRMGKSTMDSILQRTSSLFIPRNGLRIPGLGSPTKTTRGRSERQVL